MNWFNNICEESRSKFSVKKEAFKVQRKYEKNRNLMSADECYSLIKNNLKPRRIVREDIVWKIPILLICFGCVLVLLMAFCFVFNCFITKVKATKMPKRFEFDICEQQPVHRGVHSERPNQDSKTCCNCSNRK
ncbi:uncharacterized protein LOC108103056 [Drosophila eugracilis]|uniref:uncharacterized protein LOC108103056 n=1 Tax=Drosophila eugracilis TaxID=29029 RepID=UPI0007E67161|nr:uncharacterized protein LOC108103056 [Drosophila eugracilis]